MENQLYKDDLLWQTAKRRAGFKTTLLVYILVNLLLVGIWYATRGSYFWPIWPISGWGIGMLGQYIGAYHSTKLFSAEREYQKLKESVQQ